MRLGTFRLQANVTLARKTFGAAGNHFAVHRQRQATVVTLDAVMVPFSGRLRAPFARQTTHPAARMRSIGHKRRAVNGEHVAMSGPQTIRIIAIENLHLNRARERHPWRRRCVAVNEQTGVPALVEMLPLQFENEVFVHLVCSQHTGWLPRAHDHSISRAESVRRAVHVDPTGQVLSIEERNKPFLGGMQIEREDQEHFRMATGLHSLIVSGIL